MLKRGFDGDAIGCGRSDRDQTAAPARASPRIASSASPSTRRPRPDAWRFSIAALTARSAASTADDLSASRTMRWRSPRISIPRRGKSPCERIERWRRVLMQRGTAPCATDEIVQALLCRAAGAQSCGDSRVAQRQNIALMDLRVGLERTRQAFGERIDFWAAPEQRVRARQRTCRARSSVRRASSPRPSTTIAARQTVDLRKQMTPPARISAAVGARAAIGGKIDQRDVGLVADADISGIMLSRPPTRSPR